MCSGASSGQKMWDDGHMASTKCESITGVHRQPPTGSSAESLLSGGQGQRPLSWKTFSCWMSNRSRKIASFSVFCKLPSQALNLTDTGALKSRDLTSRDCFSVRVGAHYKFMFAAGSVAWAAHWIKGFSSISFCISYSYVRQTKLASFLTYSTRFTEPRMSTRHLCEASTWRHEAAHFTPVVRSCCRGCCCRFWRPWSCRCWHRRLPDLVFVLAAAAAAAVVVPRLLGLRMSANRMADCTQKLQATVSAALESWQTGFNSLIVQHVRFKGALTPLFDLQYKQQSTRTAIGQWRHCFIWCRVVQSRDVHPCYTVPRCQVSGCQSPQFWWSRDVRSRVFSRPTDARKNHRIRTSLRNNLSQNWGGWTCTPQSIP